MTTAFTAYARNDRRTILRDPLLVGVLAGPLLYSGTTWFVEPLARYLDQTTGFDLTVYYPLIISAFLVLGPIAVLGAVCGLILLEDKDQRTLAALRVTPVPAGSYPLYRVVITVVTVVTSISAAMLISPLTTIDNLAWAVPVTVSCGLLSAVVGLLMMAWAKNKVEGLAIIRALGLVVFAIPLAPWFIDSPWAWAFGIVPSFWPAKATWLAMTGDNHWPVTLTGILYSGVLAAWLLRRLARRSS